MAIPLAATAQGPLDEILRSITAKEGRDLDATGRMHFTPDVNGALPNAPSPDDLAAGPRKVGVLLPLTGPHQGLGNHVAEIIDRVFADTGIEVLKIDTQGESALADEAVNRAVEAGCVATIGGLGDRESVAIAKAAGEKNMTHFALGAVHVDTSGVVWAMPSRADLLAESFRTTFHGGDRPFIHIIFPDTPFGKATLDAAKEAALVVGAQIGVSMTWESGEIDPLVMTKEFSGAVKDAQASECGPSALLLVGDIVMSRRLLGFLDFDSFFESRDSHRCPPMAVIGTSLWNQPATIRQSGDAFENARFAAINVKSGRSAYDDVVEDAANLFLTLVMARSWGGRASVVAGLDGPLSWEGRTGTLVLQDGRISGWRVETFMIEGGVIRAAAYAGFGADSEGDSAPNE